MKGIRKRGKKFFVDYRAGGHRVREVVGTSKKQAELVLSKRKVEVVENRYFNVRKQYKILFDDFVKTFYQLHSCVNKKPKGIKRDEQLIKHLMDHFGGKYLFEIKPQMIEEYKAVRQEKVAPATVNKELACLKTMFNKAILWGKVAENPVRQVKLLKEDNRRLRYLEQGEIVKLIDACSEHLKPIVITAVFTGMRKGEIFNLQWADIDFTRGFIYLTDTKNNEKREVLMNDIVSKALGEIERTPGNPCVFSSHTGKAYTEVRKSFSTALKNSGIKDFRFHDLRHTYASQLVMMGVDIKTVQELMGHKSIEMTLRYSHLSSDHKRKAVDLLGHKMGTVWAQAPLEVNMAGISAGVNALQII